MTTALVRGGLVLLGALHLSWGVPATLAPRWFFDSFPGLGHAWTAAYPPYNGHLVTDLGATFTGARIWGPSARFEGQRVGREHPVQDGDVVEILS